MYQEVAADVRERYASRRGHVCLPFAMYLSFEVILHDCNGGSRGCLYAGPWMRSEVALLFLEPGMMSAVPML